MNQVVPFARQNSVVEYTGKQIDLIRKTVAADCTPTEFDLFMEVSRRVGLDPFRKQIYAVVYSKDNPDKRKMSIITAIDGYRAVAARNRDYRPDENPPTFEYDPSLKGPTNPGGIVSAMVKCWKLAPDGQWHPVAGIAFWDEFCPLKEIWAYDPGAGKKRPSGVFELDPKSNWFKMPRTMLPKCAEAQALRRGWPEDLSGVYTEDEMERAYVADMSASEAADQFEREKRLQITGSKDAIFVQWNPSDPLESVPLGQFADKAAAFVRALSTLPDLHGWKDTNRVALQDFWARSKSDALGLKQIMEAREKEIIEVSKA
jgi:phage recombination protein Bet